MPETSIETGSAASPGANPDGAGERPFLRRTASAAVILVPYWLVMAALHWTSPATQEQLPAGDPLVQTFAGFGSALAIPAVSLAVIAFWAVRFRPSPREVITELPRAAAGAAVAVAVAFILYWIFGSKLPSFIPPEESSRPGLQQGFSAGLIEEVLFRLMVLPAVYSALRRRLGEMPSRLLTMVAVGLLFSLSHELPPAGTGFLPKLLATRFLFPGVVMSGAAFWIGPAFIVAAHCTAHLVIPFLFR